MKRVLLLLLFPMLLFASRSHLEVWAEYLYWKPSSQGVSYGTTTLASGEEKCFYVRPEYRSGVRVGFRHIFCDGRHDFTASYLSISSTEMGRTSHVLGFPPIGSGLAGADGKVKFEYKAGDIVLGASFVRRCVLVLRLYAGIEGVEIEERQAFIFGTDQEFSRRFEFRGLGPLIGIGADYCVWGNLKLACELGVSALFGPRKLKPTDAAGVVDIYPTSNIVTPGFRAKVGANYTHCFSCFALKWELGIAGRHYPNALVRTIPRPGPSIDILIEDVTYGGPYASFTAHF